VPGVEGRREVDGEIGRFAEGGTADGRRGGTRGRCAGTRGRSRRWAGRCRIPAVYTDAVTGDTRVVGDGRLSVAAPGWGNLRVYVLGGTGRIGTAGPYPR
jgi:hypothetical protein